MIMRQNNINLSCKEATRLMVQREFEPLTISQRLRLNLHLVMCTCCRRFRVQSTVLNTALGKMDKNETENLSIEKKETIASLLKQLND